MSTPPLKIEASIQVDKGLPELPLLFEAEWVWGKYCDQFGEPEEEPGLVRPERIRYRPGKSALMSYSAEWRRGNWMEEDQFAIEIAAGKPAQVFGYPDDPYLPGLAQAASGIEAHDLIKDSLHVSPYKVRVEIVRYRPGSRAVLRHVLGWRRSRIGEVTYYARVMRPRRVERLLTAHKVASQSEFVVPHLSGSAAEAGVVWMGNVPGDTVRTQVKNGNSPDPQVLLDGVARLWSTSAKDAGGQPLNVAAGFQTTHNVLTNLVTDDDSIRLLGRIEDVLGPFTETWTPTTLAHNDFHDDQIIVTSEGELALVDFEEIGPGDPMIDVANMMAHNRWMSLFNNAPSEREAFRSSVRSAALDRFGWDQRDLAIREAFSIFRMSANPFNQLRSNWPERIGTALRAAVEVLDT